MATESPIRIMETCQNWPSHKEAASMTMGDEGHKYNGRSSAIPNRSGSAPPSMEGSLAAMEDLMQSSDLRTNFFSLSRDSETGVSGDRLIPYSSSISKFSPNVSSNPQFQHSFGRGFSGPVGNLWKFSSFDDSSNSFLRLSRGCLPTHREEPEDDRSPPQQSSDDWMVGGSTVWRGPGLPSSISQNKNMADLIQDNLHPPSSPSNNQPSITRHLSKGDAANHDDSNGSTQKTSIDDISSSNTDNLTGPVSRTSSRDCTERTLNIHLNDEPLDGDNPDITSIQSAVQTLKISTAPNLDSVRGRERTQLNHQNNLGQHLIQQQHHQNIHAQFPNSVPQLPRGMNSAYAVTNQVFRGEKFSPTEVQPVLQSSGFTPPLYASTAPYMPSANPYFSTIQAPGLIYSPQYGLGGYGFNTGVVPPYLAGYPPNAGIPLTFDARASGFPPGGSSSHAVDMQHMNKFRGQLGLTQTSFPDPRVPFNQQFGDFYGTSNQVDPSKLRGGIFGTHVSALESHKVSDFTLSNVNQRAPAHTGFLMQIPTTSIASPVLPGSPIGGSTVPGGINDANFPLHASKSPSFYGGWHHQGGFENVNYSKPYSILEELKSGKGRRFELSDIAGHVVEFSVDQHGSRFIQQKLENCSSESKASVFQEVLPHTSKLMTDVFGNYVIQKFFDYGTSEQRKELANQLAGQILPLSLQMYGCRVIQKALEVIELNQKTELVRELDGHVIRCVRDQNGNHVIQKCIESIPTEKIGFIITAFRGQIETLSKHPYGCRVIQRVLEHCTDELQSQFIVDEILESVGNLAQDQYGNYVIQHVLQRGTPEERTKIIRKLSGKVVEMSQHKFASNVVEKCLEHGDAYARELLIVEVIGINDGTDNLLVMMKDQYANYVVQKILETCTDNQRDLLLGRIRVHLHALKKYTYGKHIVARFEQLFGEI